MAFDQRGDAMTPFLALIALAAADVPPPNRLPFSPAVRAGDMVYLSGQLGTLPGTTKLATGGIEAETAQAMANIGRVLKDNGLGFADVVQCRVFLSDMADWPAFNRVYLKSFEGLRLPARSAFGANGLALGAKVEVECLAHAPQPKGK